MTTRTITIIALVAMLATACGSTAAPTATATVPPEPTATNTEVPTPTVDFAATEEAAATEQAAAIMELVGADLETAGFSMDSGQLVWVQGDPVAITANEPNSIFWQEIQDPTVPYANFVMGVDIEWDSQTGIAGCDIVYRAENNLRQGEKIVFETVRLSGYPGWDIARVKFNQYQGVLTGHMRANSAILLASGSTNHYILIANGSDTTAYANGVRLGGGTLPAANTKGIIAYETWQESGITTCTFSNGWIWELP